MFETLSSWLAIGAWVLWLLLGRGRVRLTPDDQVRDRGTLAWAWRVMVAAIVGGIVAAAALPVAAISPPSIPWVVGFVVAVAGIALREWAIWTLGRFFTQVVTISRDHRVVTEGPYRVLRHPGYAGTLLTFVGLGLTFANWVSLGLMVAGGFVAHLPRIRVEETELERSLGPAYAEFERSRKRLIPFVW